MKRGAIRSWYRRGYLAILACEDAATGGVLGQSQSHVVQGVYPHHARRTEGRDLRDLPVR